MRQIQLDGRKMDSRADTWSYLRQALDLPKYFGNNLDALADCLGELRDVEITLVYADAAQNALGQYGALLISVFEDAARRQDFRFFIQKR